MMRIQGARFFAGASFFAVAAAVALPSVAYAQAASETSSAEASASDFGDIVVTASKREQKLQDVGLTVTAIGGDALANRRVANVEDLARAVPGLSFAPSPNATPVYTMRGIGFYESSIGAYPNVATYIDQAPLIVPVMTTLTAFDLERVEVLKGPQGTLFGNNATGGAINFIANKPTNEFHAGVDLGYGRFNTVEAAGFISGPISNTLRARVSAKATKGDEWQRSYTRDDTLGKADRVAARLLLDWTPTDRVRLNININGWRDQSDTQAPAVFNEYANTITYARDSLGNLVPGGSIQSSFTPPAAPYPDLDNNGNIRTASPFLGYPLAPKNPRAADWSPNHRPYADNRFWQAVVRADLDLTDTITLTSITGYADYRHLNGTEADGTSWNAIDLVRDAGRVKSFNQELRVASTDNAARIKWVLGANYEKSSADEAIDNTYQDASSSHGGSFQGFTANTYDALQNMKNWAVFANGEFEVNNMINLRGGIRYTEAERSTISTNRETPGYVERTPAIDPGITAFFNGTWGFLTSAFRPLVCPGVTNSNPYVPITGGQSFLLNPNTCQAETYRDTLKENNVSWSVGVDIKPADDLLFYANVARGFKAGSYPVVSGATTSQYLPVRQEKVTNYEIGFKSTIRDLNMTFNGAVFYNDYRNKQVRSKIVDRIFGYLDALQNVPKSEIKGAELEISVRPVAGLNLSLAGQYLDTKVKSYIGTDPNNKLGNFGAYTAIPLDYSGADLPFAPKWQGTASIDYTMPVSDRWNILVGAVVTAQSDAISGLYGAGDKIAETTYKINSRALVDLTLGLKSNDGWKVALWGKNVFNKYYWTNATLSYDTNVRYTGRPSEYGLTVGYSF